MSGRAEWSRRGWITRRLHGLTPKPKPALKLPPSGTLSYICGVMLGDGNIDRERTIRLKVASIEFAKSFQRELRSILGKARLVTTSDGYYLVRGYSSPLCRLLASRKFVEDCAIRFPKEFLRGFYEAEGSLHSYGSRSHAQNLDFYNKETDKLSLVEMALSLLGFRHRRRFFQDKSRPMMTTSVLGGANEIAHFMQLVGPCIKNAVRPDLRSEYWKKLSMFARSGHSLGEASKLARMFP